MHLIRNFAFGEAVGSRATKSYAKDHADWENDAICEHLDEDVDPEDFVLYLMLNSFDFSLKFVFPVLSLGNSRWDQMISLLPRGYDSRRYRGREHAPAPRRMRSTATGPLPLAVMVASS